MLPIVHVANDLAHYTANFGPLRPGDLLLLIDTIEKMTTRMRIDLKTIPTVDQRRAVITQVVQVCPKKLNYLITFFEPLGTIFGSESAIFEG